MFLVSKIFINFAQFASVG